MNMGELTLIQAKQGVGYSQYYKDLETDIVARTIWGEAATEEVDIKKAIANVIQNRVAIAEAEGKKWWGNNLIQVCQKPYQFSCWNRSAPAFKKMQQITRDDVVFNFCYRLAEDVVEGRLPDNSMGATHYHHVSTQPYWAKNETPRIVRHPYAFYNLTN